MGSRPEVAKGIVLVPRTRAVEPRDTSVLATKIPGVLRVSVASPSTTCVGITVTVTAPEAAVGDCGAGVMTIRVHLLDLKRGLCQKSGVGGSPLGFNMESTVMGTLASAEQVAEEHRMDRAIRCLIVALD